MNPRTPLSRDHYPVRYVVTAVHAGSDLRTVVGGCQGRNTYDTREEAEHAIEAMRANNSASTLAMFGTPDTLEVRGVQCYPDVHGFRGDPVRSVFD